MTESLLPKVNPQYWSEQERKTDEEKQIIKSQPVPARLLNNQKHIDDKQKLELFVDYLGTKNDFTKEFPNVANMPVEEALKTYQSWIIEVENASDDEKEDARRHLGNHVADIGKNIGKGLLSGLGKVVGTPGISHTLDYLSRPGEEVAGALIYTWQQFQPGEQTFERNYRSYWNKNKDTNWFQRGWFTGAFSPVSREHGFGVPAGVHLPIEIILDPLNFIPFGLGVKVALKTQKGMAAAEAISKVTGLGRTGVAKAKDDLFHREVYKAQTESDELISRAEYDALNDDTFFKSDWRGSDDPNIVYRTGEEGGVRGQAEQAASDAAQKRRDELGEVTPEVQAEADRIYKGAVNNPSALQEKAISAGKNIDGSTASQYSGAVDVWNGIPIDKIRDLPSNVDLDDMINSSLMDDVWAELGENFDLYRDVFRLLFYTGIRPNEAKRIQWNSLAREMNQDSPEWLYITEGKASSSRLLNDDAVKFLQGFVGKRQREFSTQSGGEISQPLAAFGKQGIDLEAENLNKIFDKIARAYDTKFPEKNQIGETLLTYYGKGLDEAGKRTIGEGNNNLSYVFRLNRANQTYQLDHSISTTMKTLGHLSQEHTSRYISFFQHRTGPGRQILTEILNSLHKADVAGADPDEIITRVEKALNDKRLESLGGTLPEGAENLTLWTAKSRQNSTTKGYTETDKLQSTQEIDSARKEAILELLNSSNSERIMNWGLSDEGLKIAEEVQISAARGWKLDKYISAIEDLQKMGVQIQEAKRTKSLILTSKELVSTAGKTVEEKALIAEVKKANQNDILLLNEWSESVLDAASDLLKEVNQPNLADDVINHFADSPQFHYLQSYFDAMIENRMQRKLQEKQFGSLGGGQTYTINNIPFFDRLFLFKNPAVKKFDAIEKSAGMEDWVRAGMPEAASGSKKLGTYKPADEGWVAGMPNVKRRASYKAAREAKDAIETQRVDARQIIGYVVKAGKSSKLSGRFVIDGFTIYQRDTAGNILKHTDGSEKTRTILHTDMEDFDASEVAKIRVQKLANDPVDGSKLTLAQTKEIEEIPVSDFGDWSVSLDAQQWDPSLWRNARSSRRTAENSDTLISRIWNYGLLRDGGFSGTEMRKTLEDIESIDSQFFIRQAKEGKQYNPANLMIRLRNAGHIEKTGGTGSGTRWQWSAEIQQRVNSRGGKDAGYGHRPLPGAEGGGGSAPPNPPRMPGKSSSQGDEFYPDKDYADTNRLLINQDDGRVVGVEDLVPQPRSMRQIMVFAGDSALIQNIVQKTPMVMKKPLRWLGGQTFAATSAAKLRWSYIKGVGEARFVSSQVGQALEGIWKATGTGADGIGRKLKINPNLGVYNPRTGLIGEIPTTVIEEGVERAGTVWDLPVMKADSKRQGGTGVGASVNKEGDGPLAFMEHKFEEYKGLNSSLWSDDNILKQRKGWNQQKSLQDMGTFLGTDRADLSIFYELTPEQLKYYEWYHEVGRQSINVLRDAGFDVDSGNSIIGRSVKERRQAFVPHNTTNELNTASVGQPGMIGAAPKQFMTRSSKWQIENKMMDSAAEGYINHKIYNNDPVLALQRQVEAYYKYIAQHRFMDEFANLGTNSFNKVAKTVPAGYLNELNQALFNLKKNGTWDYMPDEAAKTLFGTTLGLHVTDWTSSAAVKKAMGRKGQVRLDEALQRMQDSSLAQRSISRGASVNYAPDSHVLSKTVLSKNDSAELQALVNDEFMEPGKWMTGPAMVANMMRIFATGADLGVMLLHGFGGIGTMMSPLSGGFGASSKRWAWPKASANMMRAMIDPQVKQKWYEQSILVRQDMEKFGIAFFRSTHTEDLPLPGLFERGKYHVGLDRPGVRQAAKGFEVAMEVPTRMMRGFGYFLDVSKTEMWKSNAQAIRMHHKLLVADSDTGKMRLAERPTNTEEALDFDKRTKLAERELNDMAASLNAVHGTLDPAAMGVSRNQRIFESAFLSYAAMYRRSAFALLNNLMSKDAWRRGPALEAASGMLMSGFALGAAIKYTGMNDDVFNPDSGDFLSAKFGDTRVGLGTPFYSYIRMGNDLSSQMLDGDFKGLIAANYTDNELLKWFRSQTSPVTSIGMDLLSGRTFIGEPLRDNVGGWEANAIGTRTSRTFLPFWMDSGIESLFFSKESSPVFSLPEFLGLRVSPIGPYGQLKTARNIAIMEDRDPEVVAWREKNIAEGKPTDSTSLPVLLLQGLETRHPHLLILKEEVSEDIKTRGSELRKQGDEYIGQIEQGREEHQKQLLGIEESYQRGDLSGKELRKRVDILEAEHRGAMTKLADAYELPLLEMEKRRESRLLDPKDMFWMDYWYDKYRAEVTGSPLLHDEYGNFDVVQFKIEEANFRLSIEAEGFDTKLVEDYIDSRRDMNKFLPPSVKKLDDAREYLSDTYWNLHHQLVKTGQMSQRQADLVDNWRSHSSQDAKDFYTKRNPGTELALKKLKRYQERLRKRNSKVDKYLVEFYDYNPKTAAGRALDRELRRNAQYSVLRI